MDPVSKIFDMADALLTAIEAAFAAQSVDLPDRRYVHHGEIAWDCEQLVVNAGPVYVGTAAAQVGNPLRCGWATTAVFSILLLRCIPIVERDESGQPVGFPTAEELQSSAEALQTDAVILFHHGVLQALQDEVFGETPDVVLQPMAAQGPQGGLAGWGLSLSVTL